MPRDINRGTSVPPVITAGAAVARRNAQLFKALWLEFLRLFCPIKKRWHRLRAGGS